MCYVISISIFLHSSCVRARVRCLVARVFVLSLRVRVQIEHILLTRSALTFFGGSVADIEFNSLYAICEWIANIVWMQSLWRNLKRKRCSSNKQNIQNIIWVRQVARIICPSVGGPSYPC